MFNHWALITLVQYLSAAFLYMMIRTSNSLLVNTEEWEGKDGELAQSWSWYSFADTLMFLDSIRQRYPLFFPPPLLQSLFFFLFSCSRQAVILPFCGWSGYRQGPQFPFSGLLRLPMVSFSQGARHFSSSSSSSRHTRSTAGFPWSPVLWGLPVNVLPEHAPQNNCWRDYSVKKRLGKTQVGRAAVSGLKAFFPQPFLPLFPYWVEDPVCAWTCCSE